MTSRGVPSRPDARDDDPLADVAHAVERAEAETGDAAREAWGAALRALDAVHGARAGARTGPRALAFRALVLERLGDPRGAARALADALRLRLDDPSSVSAGLSDLLDRLGGLEEARDVARLAVARHPGRAWEWGPVAIEAERRLELERTAPIDGEALERWRAETARRLGERPCLHDDAARPVARGAAMALRLPPDAALAYAAALGACCCDCQVARVRGPRESRDPGS